MSNFSKTIKTFADDSRIFYGTGNFDDWCVFIREGGRVSIPRDKDYFTTLQNLAKKYSSALVWDTFTKLYHITHEALSNNVCSYITDLTKENFKDDAILADKIYTILYLAMIAEERKAGTVLGKTIKALGVHQVVIEGYAPEVAAQFSRGMKAYQIKDECEKRGIYRKYITEAADVA